MTEYFGSIQDDILLALGPSIRGCCYRVDAEVMQAIVNATGDGEYFRGQEKKYLVDLSHANRLQAIAEGIPAGISGCHGNAHAVILKNIIRIVSEKTMAAARADLSESYDESQDERA